MLGEKGFRCRFGFGCVRLPVVLLCHLPLHTKELYAAFTESTGPRAGEKPIKAETMPWILCGMHAAEKPLLAYLAKQPLLKAVLCGHLHVTQIRRWRRDGGELVEFCANSVWRPQEDRPSVLASTPAEYGDYAKAHPTPMDEDHDGCLQKRTPEQMRALFDEYRSGLRRYRMMQAAGHYQLSVSDEGVSMAFYPCDARRPTDLIALRGKKVS